MYVGTDEIKAAFYKAVKKLMEARAVTKTEDFGSDDFSACEAINGMVLLVEELTKEEE